MELRPDFSGKSGLELAAGDDCVIGADAVAEKCCGAMGGFKPTPIEEECETLVILLSSMHMAGIMAVSWHLQKDDRHNHVGGSFIFSFNWHVNCMHLLRGPAVQTKRCCCQQFLRIVGSCVNRLFSHQHGGNTAKNHVVFPIQKYPCLVLIDFKNIPVRKWAKHGRNGFEHMTQIHVIHVFRPT